MNKPLLLKIIMVSVCIAAVAIGFLLNAKHSQTAKPEISGFAFPEPEALADIELISEDEEPLTEKDFLGHWTFVYVGYTFCPDACPISLNILSQMHATLAEQEVDSDVRSLLVSVDPERDTPERLKEYVKYFNEKFIGATGTQSNLASFARQVSAVYSLPEDRSTDNYLVDHSSSIILINPKAQVHAIFTPPQKAELLATDYLQLRDFFNAQL
jgi:protein SCO1/2